MKIRDNYFPPGKLKQLNLPEKFIVCKDVYLDKTFSLHSYVYSYMSLTYDKIAK